MSDEVRSPLARGRGRFCGKARGRRPADEQVLPPAVGNPTLNSSSAQMDLDPEQFANPESEDTSTLASFAESSAVVSSERDSTDYGRKVVELHLKSLPPGTTCESISCYFECQGDDVEVASFEEIGANEAVASVTGLTDEELKALLQKQHKLRKLPFTIEIKECSDSTSKNLDGCTIEVSGIDASMEEDILRFYFESNKSGSKKGAIETCSVLRNGRAQITFNDCEVAANILSRSKHEIAGCRVTVMQFQAPTEDSVQYEQDKIKISLVGGTIAQSRLSFYISTELDIDDEDFTLKMLGDNSYVLIFNSANTTKGLYEMCDKIKSIKVKQVTLAAELVKVSSSILVQNINHEYENVDDLKFYFKKSGSDVQDVHVHLIGNGKAVVTFVDPKVSERVLQRQHRRLGTNVTVEKYNEMDSDNFAQSPDVSSVQSTLAQQKFELTPNADLDPLIIRCMVRDSSCLELEHLNLKLEVKPDGVTVVSTKSVSSEWPEASRKLVVDLIHSHFTVINTGIPEASLPEMMELFQHFREGSLFEFKLSNKATVLSAGGSRDIMVHFNASMREIMDKHVQTQASHKLSHVEYCFTTQVILEQLRAAFPNLVITPNSSGGSYSLELAGSVSDIGACDRHFTELKCYKVVEMHIPTSLIEYFNTSDGRSNLNDRIKKVSLIVGVHFYHDKSESMQLQLLCKPSDLQLTQGFATKLKESIAECKIPLSESFLLTRNELSDFKSTCDSLQSQKHVQIISGGKTIVVSGFKDDLEYCVKTLTDYVKAKSMLKMNISLQDGVWKLFNTHMNRQWDTFVAKGGKMNVDITLNPDVSPPCVSLFGERVDVEKVADHLTQLKSTVQKAVIPVDRPGVCDLFTSERGRLYMDGIESRAKVAIVTLDGPEDAAESIIEDTKAFDVQTMCTASVNHIKIDICVGDITEFKADVIVNAANENLQHVGGVAQAIAKKGGAVIQEDSTQHVRRSGKVDSGCSWLTTTTGNLPCKALIHAVGPRWNGGKQKEEALLYKACKTSLENCRNYRSIVFPAISSGIYGFPITECADTMVKAAIDFSNKNPASSLQKITFIIHPSQAQQSAPFVASLKKSLPAGSIAESQISSMPSLLRVKGKEAERKLPQVNVEHGRIDVRQGHLLDVQAEVFVNTTNPDLNLSQGAVAKALLTAGGQSLQQECNDIAPVNVGDVAVTGPGNLACRYVFHTVLPSYKKRDAEKVLGKSVQKCLKKCDEKGARSIAFPAIGTGNLGYPNDVVAKTMIKEIFDYFSSNKKSKITKVYLVVFMKDTFQSFQTEMTRYNGSSGQSVERKKGKVRKSVFSPTNTDSPNRPKAFTINNVNVNISCGDVTESSCDVIVNPTDATITLAGQGVAGAILAKGGEELKELCHVLTSNGKVIDEFTPVLETKATGQLRSKSLFHICFADNDSKSFHKIVSACLQKADTGLFKSIAFPAIGTGTHRYPDEQAAAGMLNALQQFSSKNPRHLHNVDIVLFQKTTFETFIQVFQDPSSSESFLHKAKNLLLRPLGWGDSEVIAVPSRDELLHIAIYGETVEAIERAEKKFYAFMDEIFITETINISDSLTSEDEHHLEQTCKSNQVEIVIDRDPVNIIRLKGEGSKVREMKCLVLEKMKESEQNASILREAEQLYQVVKWKRMDSDETDYDKLTNYEIEQAYKRKRTGKYTQGQQGSDVYFTIDFKKMTERDHHLHSDYKVARTDIFEELKKGDFPDYWDTMPPNASLHEVDLKPGSQEYQDVVLKFEQTVRRNAAPANVQTAHGAMAQPQYANSTNTYTSIVQIQRVQNLVLYAQYIARKNEMDKNNKPGHQNEVQLFHGTDADTCPKINQQGFNRSFSGKNAVVYGNGVYFARDASYSAQNRYSPADANGYKYMYYARVLSGEYTTGKPGLLVPPSKDPNNPTILYDSVVDNIQTPSIYVTFSDASNYPDYLIVFY